MLKNIEAYSLKQVGERVLDAKSGGALLTHATDSITRKAIGTFAPAGIHINRNEYLHLPTLPITSEPRNKKANSIATDFRVLEAAWGISAEENDVHMTDSTSHNKGITENYAATEKKRNFTEKKLLVKYFVTAIQPLHLIKE